MQVFALFAYLSGVHTFYGSVETPRPLTAVGRFVSSLRSFCGSERCPRSASRDRCGSCRSWLGCAIIAPLLLFGVYTGIRITDAQLREVRNVLMSEARILSAGVEP